MTLADITRYLSLFMLVFLSACATMRNCPIETLQPAQVTFARPLTHVAICIPRTLFSEAMKTNEGASAVPSDSLIANIMFSLQQSWKKSPGYESTNFFIYLTEGNELPGASNFDLLVWLNKLQVRNDYYGEEYSWDEWEAYLYVYYTANWSIRNKAGALVDEYTDRDLMIWPSGIIGNKAQAVMNLPDVKDAWWDMGIAIAHNYAERIVPKWQTENRNIYMINKFPELSQQAYTSMRNNGYARAFDIWENMLISCRKSGQKRIKSQITYNMAVSCEFQNQVDQAVDWAKRSANISKKSSTVDYYNLLRERQKQQGQLDLQTTP